MTHEADQIPINEKTQILSHTQSLVPSHLVTIEEETLAEWLVRAALSALAGVFAFVIVAGIVLAIIVPPWYRSLEPRYQVIWCNRLSVLCDLKADRPEDNVYGLADADQERLAAADALLATDTPTPEPSWTPTPDFTATPTPTILVTTAPTDAPSTPTPTPTITLTPSITPSPTLLPLPRVATLNLESIRWERQGWNNCGPTTITIALSYFGYADNQKRAAAFLKPNIEDTNVSPEQMVEFVNTVVGSEIATRALHRMGGTPDLLKRLVTNNFPVIVERGIQLPEEGWMGHYSLIVGFDDNTDEYLLFDSYYGYNNGEGRRYKQDLIETGWQQFNYTFIVLYQQSRQSRLDEILGYEYATLESSAQVALNIARAEATRNPDDKYAWFNIGTSLIHLGNYEDAALAYDRARSLNLEFRMMWYQFGPYVAYYHTQRFNDVLAVALASERTTPYVEETYYYRGLVYAAQGNAESAVFQFDRALTYNPNFVAASEAKQAVLQGRFRGPS